MPRHQTGFQRSKMQAPMTVGAGIGAFPLCDGMDALATGMGKLFLGPTHFRAKELDVGRPERLIDIERI